MNTKELINKISSENNEELLTFYRGLLKKQNEPVYTHLLSNINGYKYENENFKTVTKELKQLLDNLES